ncbi:MAG: hypothetical protein ACFB2W_24525 [Leptolyngbyaceae cyanobacterium]
MIIEIAEDARTLKSSLQLGCAIGLSLILAPAAVAKPGWGDWQQITGSDEAIPYDAGFSNLELGGYLEYEQTCADAAMSAQAPLTYWYRLSDLVWEIGTGEVENKCQIGNETVATYSSTAVLADIDEPYCLRVNTDVGSGLRVRRDPTVMSPQIAFLPNGNEISPESFPVLIDTDATGRQWLWLSQNGWASISSGAGEYINFQLCSSTDM